MFQSGLLRSRRFAAGCCAVLAAASGAGAQVIWDESVDGDLSGDRSAPTALTLSLGSNSLTATSVKGDIEYVRLDVPDGLYLSAINLVSFASDSKQSFIAVQAGTTFTEDPAAPDVAKILGWAHFGPGTGTVGTDILDDMGIGAGAIGFMPPLGSGPYTYWIQETGTAPATYNLDFIVVPAPGLAGLALGAGLLAARRRR